MRRTLWSACAGALIGALAAPVAARADVLDVYRSIVLRELSPPPLVPTSAPPAFSPIDRNIQLGTSIRPSGYGVRLVHYGPSGPDAVVALSRGDFGSVSRALRYFRRVQSFRARATRVRGRRAYVLKRRADRQLLWAEDGRVYRIGSATPRKVSLSQLRATAADLDHLGGYYLGGSADPSSSSGADAVTTDRTITIHVEFEAACPAPGATGATVVAGQTSATLLPRSGNSFSFDIAQHRVGEGEWNGSVSGTIADDAVSVDVRATGTYQGMPCDSGPLRLTLQRNRG